MDACHAKGCNRPTDNILCEVCLVEMEVLMRNEMAKRLGRQPTEAEFDILLERVERATVAAGRQAKRKGPRR